MSKARAILIWGALSATAVIPIAAAATSPLLAWREPIYIAAGFAGIAALVLLLVQPLLVAGFLPGFESQKGRRVHRLIGTILVVMIVLHVGGLWITSPPDVIDALLFASPTSFSVWGVIAMWTLFAAALLVVFRQVLSLRPRIWRRAHTLFVAATVVCSVVHAILIEGTMETVTKIGLCAVVLIATVKAVIDLRAWSGRRREDA